jgi:DNA-binding NarL/FixJ family response regulator
VGLRQKPNREDGIDSGAVRRDVVLLDEQPIWLVGLAAVLSAHGIRVLGTATTPERALELVEATSPLGLVASVELQGPDMDGVECLRRARERFPGLRIVAVSTHNDVFHLNEAAAAGADVYLPKTADPDDVAATIGDCLANGRSSRACARRLEDPSAGGPGLTARELEIVHLAARGFTNAEIAQRLWVTKWTVKFHLANAYRKLGVSNRTQAARYLFEHGVARLGLDRSASAS